MFHYVFLKVPLRVSVILSFTTKLPYGQVVVRLQRAAVGGKAWDRPDPGPRDAGDAAATWRSARTWSGSPATCPAARPASLGATVFQQNCTLTVPRAKPVGEWRPGLQGAVRGCSLWARPGSLMMQVVVTAIYWVGAREPGEPSCGVRQPQALVKFLVQRRGP